MKTCITCCTLLITLLTASCQTAVTDIYLKAVEAKGNVKSISYTTYLVEPEDNILHPDQLRDKMIVATLRFNYNEYHECTDETYISNSPYAKTLRVNEIKDRKLVKQTVYDWEDKIKETYTVLHFSKDTLRMKIENEYGEDIGIMETIFENGYIKSSSNPHDKSCYELGRDGNKTSFRVEGLGRIITGTTEYLEYDDRGNWTKKIEKSHDGSEDYTYIYTERTFEYYD